jgi:hypothetical protein
MTSAQDKSDKSKCSRQVRDLPLERFRLPLDGRKWRVLARQRRALLLDISQYANRDGTFRRQLSGQAESVNFSPSAERLLKHWANGSLYRYQNDLRLLDLLDWGRPNRQHRRIYVITVDAPYPFRPEHLHDSKTKHVPNSEKKDLPDALNSDLHDSHPDLRDSQADLRDSNPDLQQLEGTSVSSLPSFEVPSTTRPPISPTGVGDSNGDELFWWHKELVCIRRGRRKRLPNLDKYVGNPAQDVCDFLIRGGFCARVVTEPIVMPDHIPRLDPITRTERNIRFLGLTNQMDPDEITRRNLQNAGLLPKKPT